MFQGPLVWFLDVRLKWGCSTYMCFLGSLNVWGERGLRSVFRALYPLILDIRLDLRALASTHKTDGKTQQIVMKPSKYRYTETSQGPMTPDKALSRQPPRAEV